MVDHRPSSYGLQAPWLNRGPTTAALTGQFFLIPFLNLPHVRPHAVMKLSLRTAFLQAKSALAFDAWFFYYTRSTSKTCLHQMALSAWKATAQQSISNSAIQSSVKGMRKGRKERKDIKKERNSCKDCWSQCASCFHPSLFFLLQDKLLLPSSVIFLGAFQRNCMWKLVTKQHIRTFHPHEGAFKFGTPEG